MSFANSAISDIIATTIQSRSGKLADNLTDNNALLTFLRQKGNVRTFSGGNVILEEIFYPDSTTSQVNSYSGYETLPVGQHSPISAAQFSIAQYAAPIVISGLEMLQNSGKEQIIDLMEGRMKVAEADLVNRISTDIYGDGTGNSGKNLTGLSAAVPDDPTTGTYGGIDRASWSFWQSVKYSGSSDGGTAVSASNIIAYMTTLGSKLVRGKDRPDTFVADDTYYNFYVNALQAIQRVTDEKEAGAGFSSLKFYGAGIPSRVILDGGIGGTAPSAHMFALNTNYIHWRPHKDRNFVPIGGERQAVNQDAIVKYIGWAGNITMSGSRYQGVLIA